MSESTSEGPESASNNGLMRMLISSGAPACNTASTNITPEPPHIPYHVQIYDIHTLKSSLTILRPAHSTSAALDLLDHGYIAKTPGRPEVAVAVKTLELLYRLRQRKASFSIEAFAKVVCDYYQVCGEEFRGTS